MPSLCFTLERLVMIGIWYVPKKDKFYARYVRTAYFYSYYKVGYVNQYNHRLVALFYIAKNKLVQCNSLADYYSTKKLTFKKRLINRIIDLLYKI